jgi:ParB-like chromosome segregation protein Spo0J
MSGSKLRSHDRQRVRAEVAAAVAGLPIPYVLEAMGERLEVQNGRFEVRLQGGFMLGLTRVREADLDRRVKAATPPRDLVEVLEALCAAAGIVGQGSLMLTLLDGRVQSGVITESFTAAALWNWRGPRKDPTASR